MGRAHAAAIWLPDGRIFVIGGRHIPTREEWCCSVEVYTRIWNATNPIQDSWKEATPMPTAVIAPSAALVHDRIFLVGEKTAAVFSPPSQVDDTKPGQWTTLSCPHDLTYIFGRDDHIFAIGITKLIRYCFIYKIGELFHKETIFILRPNSMGSN